MLLRNPETYKARLPRKIPLCDCPGRKAARMMGNSKNNEYRCSRCGKIQKGS